MNWNEWDGLYLQVGTPIDDYNGEVQPKRDGYFIWFVSAWHREHKEYWLVGSHRKSATLQEAYDCVIAEIERLRAAKQYVWENAE